MSFEALFDHHRGVGLFDKDLEHALWLRKQMEVQKWVVFVGFQPVPSFGACQGIDICLEFLNEERFSSVSVLNSDYKIGEKSD